MMCSRCFCTVRGLMLDPSLTPKLVLPRVTQAGTSVTRGPGPKLTGRVRREACTPLVPQECPGGVTHRAGRPDMMYAATGALFASVARKEQRVVGRDEIRIVTFDCYGTLIDSAGGSGAFLYDLALRRSDPDVQPGWALRDRLEAIQFELIQGPYRSYRQILTESLRRYFAERRYAWDEREADGYVRSMGCWQPFPDTRPALRRVHDAGLRLAIISNTDRDIMAHKIGRAHV